LLLNLLLLVAAQNYTFVTSVKTLKSTIWHQSTSHKTKA